MFEKFRNKVILFIDKHGMWLFATWVVLLLLFIFVNRG